MTGLAIAYVGGSSGLELKETAIAALLAVPIPPTADGRTDLHRLDRAAFRHFGRRSDRGALEHPRGTHHHDYEQELCGGRHCRRHLV